MPVYLNTATRAETGQIGWTGASNPVHFVNRKIMKEKNKNILDDERDKCASVRDDSDESVAVAEFRGH